MQLKFNQPSRIENGREWLIRTGRRRRRRRRRQQQQQYATPSPIRALEPSSAGHPQTWNCAVLAAAPRPVGWLRRVTCRHRRRRYCWRHQVYLRFRDPYRRVPASDQEAHLARNRVLARWLRGLVAAGTVAVQIARSSRLTQYSAQLLCSRSTPIAAAAEQRASASRTPDLGRELVAAARLPACVNWHHGALLFSNRP